MFPTAQYLLARALNEGGGTIHPFVPFVPTSGYMVGNGREHTLDLATATVADVEAWIRRVVAEVAEASEADDNGYAWPANTYVGSWVDGDTLYLDVSECHADEGMALAVAERLGELAIFDLDTMSEIRV